MVTICKYLFVILLLCSASASNKANEYSLGFGKGSMYTGLGLNYGRVSNKSFSYLSVGTYVLGYGSSIGLLYDYGFSSGYLSTRYSKNNRNAIGVNIGVSYAKPSYQYEGSSFKAGIDYYHFFSGLGNRGWVLGVGVMIQIFGDEYSFGGPLNIGYQF